MKSNHSSVTSFVVSGTGPMQDFCKDPVVIAKFKEYMTGKFNPLSL